MECLGDSFSLHPRCPSLGEVCGDIVSINHKTRNTNGQLIDEVAGPEKRFVVYNIEYARNNNGPEMTVYISEVS